MTGIIEDTEGLRQFQISQITGIVKRLSEQKKEREEHKLNKIRSTEYFSRRAKHYDDQIQELYIVGNSEAANRLLEERLKWAADFLNHDKKTYGELN
jgi:hypothetical protein